MAAAKRPTRKSGSSGKAKAATTAKKAKAPAGAKAASRKAASKKAAAKPATKARKAAPKIAPKAKEAASARTRKAPAKSAPAPKPERIQAKAAHPEPRKTTAAREPVSRTPPGLVKTDGSKRPARPRKSPTHARPVFDPDALIHGIRPYRSQPGESYMNAAQLDHFRRILNAWKRELMEEVDRTVHHMQDEASNFPDPNDRATQESEFGLELRTRDRERKLLKKIASALERIDEGSYGYCEETGEEIGLRRLEARPVATLSVEAQERRELAERQYGERDDRYR